MKQKDEGVIEFSEQFLEFSQSRVGLGFTLPPSLKPTFPSYRPFPKSPQTPTLLCGICKLNIRSHQILAKNNKFSISPRKSLHDSKHQQQQQQQQHVIRNVFILRLLHLCMCFNIT